MFHNLKLTRPLAVIDLETTGTNPKVDRIVEVCVLRVQSDGEHAVNTRRLNPEMKIPKGATSIHGITDADVAQEITFRDYAPDLATLLSGCDLCGFNLKKFDLRMLQAEFQRVGHPFQI